MIHKTLFSLVLISFFISNLHSAFAETVEFPSAFQEFSQKELSPQELQKLQDSKIIFISGIFSDPHEHWNQSVGWYLEFLKVEEHFQPQIDYFKSLGVETERLNHESEQTINYNITPIFEAIRKSKKPVILFTHSKGGLEALQAIIQFPELKNKVTGWVALQSPFYGSPVADLIMKTGRAVPWGVGVSVLDFVMKMFVGTQKTIDDLTSATREIYMKGYETEILEVTSRIKTINVPTWRRDKWGLDTPFEPVRDWMADHQLKNDGLVAIDKAGLPGSTEIVLPEIDHVAAVLNNPLNPIDHKALTTALLHMVLNP